MREDKELRFTQLINEKLPMLQRVVYRIVANESDTDDVIQSALLKAWKNYDSYRDNSQFASWICRIACNQAYDLFRRRQREAGKLELFAIHANEAADDSAALDRLALVEQTMKSLPSNLHAALSLTVFENMSPDKVAAILGCTKATVYWRIHRARKILKKNLEKYYEKR